MKIEDMVMVINNQKGIEKNFLCSFESFVKQYVTNACDNFFEVAEEFPGDGAARRLFAREALGPEREDDVIGREWRAVVEPDAGAQLELYRVG